MAHVNSNLRLMTTERLTLFTASRGELCASILHPLITRWYFLCYTILKVQGEKCILLIKKTFFSKLKKKPWI